MRNDSLRYLVTRVLANLAGAALLLDATCKCRSQFGLEEGV